MTELISRIADGRTDLVFEHLSEGGMPDATDRGGVSLIKWCAYYGDVSAIRFLIRNGEALESLGDNLDLNGAAFHGHWRLCQYLIENGADVNTARSDTGETPLHAALCKANRPAYDFVVEVLLAAGADPTTRTFEGAETGSFMRDCRTRAETPLHRAAAFGTLRSIELLLEAGAPVEARDMHGDTPLSWASWHLRPAPILAKLCHGPYSIHPESIGKPSTDHGIGWGGLEFNLLGRPHL